MRREFAKVIAELAEKDNEIYLIIGDTGYKHICEYKARFPDRVFNFGTAEQNMIAMAAGMSLEGLVKPWVFAITPFLIERPFEFIKNCINYQSEYANVKLVGYADYPEEGPTHSLVNEKLPDVFTNINVHYPKNSAETREAMYKAYEHHGPDIIILKKDRTL